MPKVDKYTKYNRIVSVDELRKEITIYRFGRESHVYVWNKRRDWRLRLTCQDLWFEGRSFPDLTHAWCYGIDPII
jgi:hypothetical protein